MTEFDPYYKWLGIVPAWRASLHPIGRATAGRKQPFLPDSANTNQPRTLRLTIFAPSAPGCQCSASANTSSADQPANHYRLLGVQVFEPDMDVIQAAADRQMTYLRSLNTGNRVQMAQKLLNEVSAAGSCLLNPAKKAAYDLQLHAQLDAMKPAMPAPSSPVILLESVGPILADLSPLDTAPLRPLDLGFQGLPHPQVVRANSPGYALPENRAKNKPFPPYLPWAIGGGAFAVLALLAIVAVIFVRPRAGTLIVEVDQPNSTVKVVNANGRVAIDQIVANGKVAVAVEPGSNRLNVDKPGFNPFSVSYDISAGEKKIILVRLLAEPPKISKPLEKPPVRPPFAKSPSNPAPVIAKPAPPAEPIPNKPVSAVAQKLDSTSSATALEFNGSNSYVATPVFYDGTFPLTIEAWVSNRRANGSQYIVGDSEGAVIELLIRNNRFEMSYRPTTPTSRPFGLVDATAADQVTIDRPYHVAGILDQNEARLYVDGVMKSSAKGTAVTRSALPLAIGANPGGKKSTPPYFSNGGELFVGWIREVRFSKVARYSGNFKPSARLNPDANTIALYHCDEGNGTILTDASGNGQTATIVNAKWVKVNMPE